MNACINSRRDLVTTSELTGLSLIPRWISFNNVCLAVLMSSSQDCCSTFLSFIPLLFLSSARGQYRPSVSTGRIGNGGGGWEGPSWNKVPQPPSPAGPLGRKTGGGGQGGEEEICHCLDGAGSWWCRGAAGGGEVKGNWGEATFRQTLSVTSGDWSCSTWIHTSASALADLIGSVIFEVTLKKKRLHFFENKYSIKQLFLRIWTEKFCIWLSDNIWTYWFEFDSFLDLFQQGLSCCLSVQITGLLFHLPQIYSSEGTGGQGTTLALVQNWKNMWWRTRRERKVVSPRTTNPFPRLKVSKKIWRRAQLQRRSLPFLGWSGFLRLSRSKKRMRRKRLLWRGNPFPFFVRHVSVLMLQHLVSYKHICFSNFDMKWFCSYCSHTS